MAYGFRKSIRLGKGVKLNLSKSGLGVSAGVKGLRVGMNSKGSYVHGSIPGTGIYSRQQISGGNSSTGAQDFTRGLVGCGTFVGVVILLILTVIAPPVGLLGWAVIGYFYWKHTKTAPYKNKRAKNAIDKHDIDSARLILNEIQKPNRETHFLICLLDYADKNYAEAVKGFQALREEEEPPMGAIYPLADSLVELQRYSEATSLLQKLCEGDEKETRYLNLLARCFSQQGKHELAIETLKKAPTRKRNLDQDLLETLYQLGVSSEALGKPKDAKRYYERVCAEDASYQDVNERLEGIGS
ncbi:hypothetical protein COV06_01430 [Candidatus Uhrbacteria bacterium CG10_big_fil_rev_8_21_14_0_10_50_16]|uniref:DUF4236 domain-containing protein n=1 Tax=Candidatus Uhrbacteria bacterium CG10_big_fil_rev_8_21_14_0_10_50_16 TaxID=1975039 RepID=A0A2H0RNB8_9BACT|nr:MAG: hypothetical protein COV06_01430 [Candidatus Uhrbacteria bacterium CG10_big_fil_rev_8_21_14_0_10_50_16]